MTFLPPLKTPSTVPRNRLSNQDAISTMLPQNGTSPGAVADEGVVLFSSHYDISQGNALALMSLTPSRNDSTAATLAADHPKRLRSSGAVATSTAAPTPSGQPRKKNTRLSTPPSPRRAARAVSSASALESRVSAPEPPSVARTSPSAVSAVIAGAFALTSFLPFESGVPLP